MSLYRKYRPQTFADVVGQDHIVTTLEQAAEQDKLAHAYLFAGSRGTGKTSVARILAKILMIRGVEDETLQGQIIRGVEEGSIVDLLEIDAASNRGIDDIRNLVEKIQFSPVVAKAKVYIIDEVHMLTKEAFNALLKTLEEPPPYAHFILATTELNKIPSTIQSRCQCFPFRAIREEDIIRRLQYISDQEHINIDRESLRSIARHVEGGLRDAISLLDQMRSLETITQQDVEQRIGSTGHEYIDTIFSALEEKDTNALIQTVQKLEENGVSLESLVRQLLKTIRGRLHESIEAKKPTADTVTVLNILLIAIRDMRISPIPGLVLESALISICNRDEKAEKNTELFAVEKKEKEVVVEKQQEKAPAEKVVKKEKEKPAEKVEAPAAAVETTTASAAIEARELSLESLQKVWTDIVKQTSPAPVKMSLKNGRLTALEDTKVVLTFPSAFHRDTVAKAEASRAVEAVMEKLFNRALRLECILDKSAPVKSETADSSVSLAEAAAEIF
jgi:DNA polymerase-3 subunit gamma/tau